jgi:cell division protein FtsI (penicillin-binding protein 3)
MNAPKTVYMGAGRELRKAQHSKWRMHVVMCGFMLCYFLLALKLIDVTVADRSFAELWDETSATIETVGDDTMQGVKVMKGDASWDNPRFQPSIPPVVLPRQSIRDRNGVLLAASVPTRSLYVRPREIQNHETVARNIAALLPNMEYETVLRRLHSPAKFVWLKRHLTPQEQEAFLWAGIPGIYLHDDYNRIYPHHRLASHIIGYTDIDGQGLAGVEKYFNADMARTDRLKPITLSVDIRLQHILYEAVAAGMEKHSAIAAAGAIFHIPTSEAVAMVSLPDFDPNRHQHFTSETKFNQLSVGKYELGSIFKTVSLALALESGAVTLQDSFDATLPARYQGGVIHDFHAKKRWLNVPEILVYSSNIGTAKMVEKAGIPAQRRFLRDIGMFESVGIELHEQAIPTTRATWKPIDAATISFGHGLSVTPLHLIRSMLTINGGGQHRELTLLKDNQKEGRQLLHPTTSTQVNRLMRAVVQHGTATKADVKGYAVGAKTGTADKVVDGKYHHEKKLSSLVAAFPMPNPEYFIFVMFDEPKGTKDTYNYATAGWIAAPVASNIIREMTPLVGMTPIYDAPPDEVDAMILEAAARAKQGIVRPSYVQQTAY